MEPTADTLIVKTKHVRIWNWKWKLYIHWILIEKSVLIGWQTTILHHEHPQAQLLSRGFVEVRIHNTLTWEDEVYPYPWFYDHKNV